MFVEELVERIRDKKSVVCMGLDPRVDQIPTIVKDSSRWVRDFADAGAIIDFNKALIDEVHDIIPVIKPNIAFYESYDIDGLKALKSTVRHAHKQDLLVILDSKRGDIGTTSQAYAHSTFKVYGADACTLNGYFGIDGIKPYLENYPEKGVFILVKTSNRSSEEFQDLLASKYPWLVTNLAPNYARMAHLINRWRSDELPSGYQNIGAVVGATNPEQIKEVRDIVPTSFLLLPGYGAQGATAKDIGHAFDERGLGAVVNSSRGIMFAWKARDEFMEKDFARAAREEVTRMNREINKEIGLK